MADPVTLALVAAGTAATSQVVGGVAGARAAQAQGKIAGQQAEIERRAASVDERNQRNSAMRYRAAQRAAYSGSGVTTTGTALNVLAQTAEEQERDALAIRYGGQLRSARAISEKSLAKRRGQASLVSGFGQAGQTLLGSGAFNKGGS
jgi:hypothetical protein